MDPRLLLEETFAVSFDENAGVSNLDSYQVQLYTNELLFFKEMEIPSSSGWLSWLWPGTSSAKEECQTKQIFKRVTLKDVIGCHVSEITSDDYPDRNCFEIYWYPRNESERGTRCRQKLTLFYDSVATYDQSSEVVLRWKHLITFLCRLKTDQPSEIDLELINNYLSGKTSDLACKKRRYLILLNPVSGPSQGKYVFEKSVSKMLQEAEIDYTLFITEYCGHAKEFIQQDSNLFQYDGIVAASGDGLFHEVINGIFSRPDWQAVVRIPLGLIPLGSGNTLSSMICEVAGETPFCNHLIQAMFLLTKFVGTPKPFDLLAVDTLDGRLYSFLWTAWGLLSDVDIESEVVRFLGGIRFDIFTLLGIITLRRYQGRLSFLPADGTTDGNENNHPPQQSSTSGAIETPLLPPLTEPVPKNWKTIEDDAFICFVASHCSHVTSKSILNKSIRLDDGLISILVHRAPRSNRWTMANDLIQMALGNGIEHSKSCEWYRVRAFRLEPGPPTSTRGHILTVDGERIRYGPIQAQILPKAALLM